MTSEPSPKKILLIASEAILDVRPDTKILKKSDKLDPVGTVIQVGEYRYSLSQRVITDPEEGTTEIRTTHHVDPSLYLYQDGEILGRFSTKNYATDPLHLEEILEIVRTRAVPRPEKRVHPDLVISRVFGLGQVRGRRRRLAQIVNLTIVDGHVTEVLPEGEPQPLAYAASKLLDLVSIEAGILQESPWPGVDENA